jgi:predicted nucleic acid-binding protein
MTGDDREEWQKRRAVLTALWDVREKLGESPTVSQYQEERSVPSVTAIKKVYGTWNEAKEAAGLETVEFQDPPDPADPEAAEEWERTKRRLRNGEDPLNGGDA